jgi:hypothetical protein
MIRVYDPEQDEKLSKYFDWKSKQLRYKGRELKKWNNVVETNKNYIMAKSGYKHLLN